MLSIRSIVLATTAAAALVPAAASAGTYCVFKPGCSGLQEWSFQDAITDAGKDTEHVRIELGPGTFSGGVVVPDHAAGLDIVGSGPETTILEPTIAGSYALELHGGTVSQVGFSFPDLGGAGPKGLHLLDGAGADHIRAVMLGAYPAESIRIERGGNLSQAYIDAGSHAGVQVGGNLGPGDVTIADSYVRGVGPVSANNPGHTLVATRDRLVATDGGMMTSGGTTRLEDSLLDTRGHGGPMLLASAASAPAAAIEGRRLTLLADNASSSGALASSASGAGSATVTLSDSVLLGAGLRAISAGNGAPLVAISRVDTWPAAPDKLAGGKITDEGSFSTDPLLGTGYVPGAGSPLIDAAAALGDGESDTDLAGAARALDGDGNCDARPDIGAFEGPAQACTSSASPAQPSVAPDPPAGDALAPRVTQLRIVRRRAVGFTISEAARVTVRVSRAHHRAIVLHRSATVGRVTLRLKRILRHGRYAIRVTAVDGAGNRSAPAIARRKI